jgi:hypothetical protein
MKLKSQVYVKKRFKNCINILLYEKVVPVFIAEINCKLRYRGLIKFSYALSFVNTFIHSNIIKSEGR